MLKESNYIQTCGTLCWDVINWMIIMANIRIIQKAEYGKDHIR